MKQKRWTILVILIIVIVPLALSLLVNVVYAGRPQSPAVELVDLQYEVYEGCPADIVPYAVTWQVERQSLLIISSSHWRGLDAEGDAAIVGRMPDAALIGVVSPRVLIDLDSHFDLPEIEPGEYARVVSVGTISEDSKPAQVMLPYTIRDDCP